MNGKYEPPEPNATDTAHLVVRGVLSVVPGAPELFEYFITPPLEKRRNEWMKEVGEALQNLEENWETRLEVLQSNEAFVDTVLQASQIAVRNSQHEKRTALKNAITNAALPDSPEQSLQQMFLNLIDILTVWHLRILKLFDDPRQWASDNNHRFREINISGSLSRSVLESAFPELHGKGALYDQIWNELYQRGLVSIDSLHGMMTANGVLGRRTTELGRQFLNFIERPEVS